MNFEVTHSDADIRQLIAGSPWLDFNRLRISDSQGYSNGRFGYKAAHHSHIEYLYHEIAHAIDFMLRGEMGRIKFERFIFNLPTEYICGTFVCEPDTLKATEREIRTVAIQYLLLKDNPFIEFNHDDFFSSQAKTLHILPDFILIPSDNTLNHDERKKQRFEWIRKSMADVANSYDINEIKESWGLVLDRIEVVSEKASKSIDGRSEIKEEGISL